MKVGEKEENGGQVEGCAKNKGRTKYMNISNICFWNIILLYLVNFLSDI